MYDILTREIKGLNGQLRIAPIDILQTLANDTSTVQKGEYGSDLIDLIANNFFSFGIPELPFAVHSIIVAATPSPYVMVAFNWKGKRYAFPNESFLPYVENSNRVKEVLRHVLEPMGYHVHETEQLPMKPLAVRSGLGSYGRNNVTYVAGMGSFIAIKAFFSDIPCGNGIADLQRMANCEHCSICPTRCPTGAIKTNRHIIKAEECLTYLNEFIDAEGFPDWLSVSAHNSLHGCIVCQAACPQNKPYLPEMESQVEFTEQETQQLLDGVCMDGLEQAMADKIKLLCLEDYLPLLPRNLFVLFAKEA